MAQLYKKQKNDKIAILKTPYLYLKYMLKLIAESIPANPVSWRYISVMSSAAVTQLPYLISGENAASGICQKFDAAITHNSNKKNQLIQF